MCFSKSLRLLWSKAVIVSSASTSYPICFCMKRNCLAMYSCRGEGEGTIAMMKGLLGRWREYISYSRPPGSSCSPAGNVAALCSKACRCVWTERGAGRPAPQAAAWGRRHCRWKGLGVVWISATEIEVFSFYFLQFISGLGSLICSRHTCFKIFCSLMSFCLSRLGLLTMISKTSCPLFGMSTTKKTRSSRSLVTNLQSTYGSIQLMQKDERFNFLSTSMVQGAQHFSGRH